MSTPNDGGEHIPAFPETWGNSDSIITNPGMTLRDYFAGQWLAGMGADSEMILKPEGYAKWAYDIADAMLAERDKR